MGQENNPPVLSKHHFRPQSRGGNHSPENLQEISDEELLENSSQINIAYNPILSEWEGNKK